MFLQTKQNCFFLSELRQISTNFDTFWHTDGHDDKIMWGALIFRLILQPKRNETIWNICV